MIKNKIKGLSVIVITVAVVFCSSRFIMALIAKCKSIERQEKSRNIDYSVMVKWLNHRQDGVSLEEYFQNKNIRQIALYDMNESSLCLCKELEQSSVKIEYAIVHGGTHVHTYLPIYSLDQEFPKVDAIIVMNPYQFAEIKKELSDKVDFEIISIEDIVYTL